jgi:hypothetical protein
MRIKALPKRARPFSVAKSSMGLLLFGNIFNPDVPFLASVLACDVACTCALLVSPLGNCILSASSFSLFSLALEVSNPSGFSSKTTIGIFN